MRVFEATVRPPWMRFCSTSLLSILQGFETGESNIPLTIELLEETLTILKTDYTSTTHSPQTAIIVSEDDLGQIGDFMGEVNNEIPDDNEGWLEFVADPSLANDPLFQGEDE